VEQFDARQASIIAVQEVPLEHTRRYGIVAGKAAGDRLVDVDKIVEKPAPEVAPSRLGVAGLLRHEKVFAYRYDGRRYDCGSKEGFLQANVELALADRELGADFRAYL